MSSFYTTRKFLNELVDESFLAYLKSLESRRRCEDGSVQDLNAIRYPTVLSEYHQLEQSLDCRLQLFERQTDQFLDTKESYSLPSQVRFYEEIVRFHRALTALRDSFLGDTPKPEMHLPLSLSCNTRGWQDSFSLLHAHRLLDSLLYHFRNSLLSLLLSCGEEHTSLAPEHSAKRREKAERDLRSKASEASWISLTDHFDLFLSLDLSDTMRKLMTDSLDAVQSKLPMLFEKLAAAPGKVFFVRDSEPALIESDFTSTLGGVLVHKNDSRDMFVALNDWSTEAYCSLTDLSQRTDGSVALGSRLAQTLGYVVFLKQDPFLPPEVESYPPLQSFCHALGYFVREDDFSADWFTRALAEYRPTYEALYLLYAPEEVSSVLKQWSSSLPERLQIFAKDILRQEAFEEAWAKSLLYSSSGL